MTETMTLEASGMKREQTLLNLICFVFAAGFLALVVYDLFAAGNIISTDGLFLIVVPMVFALAFLSVPGQAFISKRLEHRALKAGGEPKQLAAGNATAGRPAAVSGAVRTAPALKDPKGRPMPPDVNRMVAEMQKGSEQ